MGQLKGLYLGLLVTLLGLILSWAPYGFDLEERYGLRWLFWSQDTERRELEAALAREVAGLNAFPKRLGGIDLHAVASALPSNSALVELVKSRRYDLESIQTPGRDLWQEYRYLAAVLVDGAPHAVRIVDLGEALTIDRAMTRFRSWIMRAANARDRGFVSDDEPSPDAIESPGMALRAAVFDPLRPVLGGRSRVILATDGELARIPFDALPLDSAGRYLADDYRLSSSETAGSIPKASTASPTTTRMLAPRSRGIWRMQTPTSPLITPTIGLRSSSWVTQHRLFKIASPRQ